MKPSKFIKMINDINFVEKENKEHIDTNEVDLIILKVIGSSKKIVFGQFQEILVQVAENLYKREDASFELFYEGKLLPLLYEIKKYNIQKSLDQDDIRKYLSTIYKEGIDQILRNMKNCLSFYFTLFSVKNKGQIMNY